MCIVLLLVNRLTAWKFQDVLGEEPTRSYKRIPNKDWL